MPRHLENPASNPGGKGQTTAESDEVRVRLLKMIVENEESRKSKSP